jgi:DNA polymerase I-like protein with 3'-5' exonuclease and polymerase domains
MAGKEELGSRLLKASICPSTWPKTWLLPYSARDVVVGEALFLRQRATLKRLDKMKTLFTRCIFTPCLVDIEKVGVHLDKERVMKVHKDYVIQLRDLQAKLDIITGGANPASPKQMRVVLYEDLKFKYPTHSKHFTETGEPTTSYDKYLCTLKPKNKKQEGKG